MNVKSVSGVLKIGSPNYVKTENHPSEVDATHPQAVVHKEQPTTPGKSQMQILQEIENGELSVDEALEQMNL